MRKLLFLLGFLLQVLFGVSIISDRKISGSTNSDYAENIMNSYEYELSKLISLVNEVKWKYSTNITEAARNIVEKTAITYKKFLKDKWESLTSFDWKKFQDQNLYRKFKLVSVLGWEALEEEDYKTIIKITQRMEIYQTNLTVCTYEDPKVCNKSYEYILSLFKMYPPEERLVRHGWLEVHNGLGKLIKPFYKEFVKYVNKAAKMNDFKDNSEMAIFRYETEDFTDKLLNIWEQIKPLYFHLHAYVRRKLINIYGSDVIRPDGPIPAHLTGDFLGWNWKMIENITKPFPHIRSMDVTSEMLQQNLTVKALYKLAEKFFTSLGFRSLSSKFWEHSLFEKPSDRKVVCSGSTWDMNKKDDYRIKMCSKVSMHDFFLIHHKMGHIQYYMEYKDQPYLYRQGANPGFHEAVGDTVTLSVATPTHLHKIGLLPDIKNSRDEDIAHLYAVALETLPFMAYTLFFDSWQWRIFRGNITEDDYNTQWWEMRKHFQGVSPPMPRNDEYFDPAPNYHLAVGAEVITYFVARVLQFQFHKSLCIEADQYVFGSREKPLHKCDIYNNPKAGQLLRKMLQMGASKSWQEAINVITKGKAYGMDASPLLEYFQPLMSFLKEQNRKNKETTGWAVNSSQQTSRPTSTWSPVCWHLLIVLLCAFLL